LKMAELDTKEFESHLAEWKESRVRSLTSPTGWLTLCGLDFLEEGDNKVGSDKSNAVVLPESCPAFAGNLVLHEGKIRFEGLPGFKYEIDGQDKTGQSVDLLSDDGQEPTLVWTDEGNVHFFVIKRDGKLAVRMKNKKAASYVEFKGLNYFPADKKWVVPAVFKPFERDEVMGLSSAGGLKESHKNPGVLEFEIDGTTYSLHVVAEEDAPDQYWILFKDLTNGKQTYGMRYLYCDRPKDGSNQTFIDFNRAYNPPCSFTTYATCPRPPKSNYLKLAIEAGETYEE